MPTLYLIPVPVAEESGLTHIPAHNAEIVRKLKHFIAEDAKTARRHLKLFGYPSIQEAEIALLNEHTDRSTVSELLVPMANGHDTGLMSDAGCPGIADPGSDVIRMAHAKGYSVVPLTGPSSIVLPIMSSGFNGQNFAFNGYLPQDRMERMKKLRLLEQLAARNGQAQFFIETPYRSEQMLTAALEALGNDTLLYAGIGLTSPGEKIYCMKVSDWKKKEVRIGKTPTVFGIWK